MPPPRRDLSFSPTHDGIPLGEIYCHMPRLAKYKYTGLTGPLREILRDAPTRDRPDKVTKDWLRSFYGVSSNGESIISVLRFVGLIKQHDGSPTDLWDTISHRTPADKIRFARAVRDAYYDLFEHYPDAHRRNDDTLRVFFERQVNSGPEARRNMLSTFKTLLLFGDFDAVSEPSATIDLPELVESVKALDHSIHEWLKGHNKHRARTEALDPIRGRLDAISLEQQQQESIKDSIRAAEAGLFSAAHVLAWIGFTGFFYEPFTVDAVKAEHPDWEMKRIENLLRANDYDRIEAGWKQLGFYNRATEKTLHGLLNDRNRCAHGSGYDPDLNETLAFLKKLADMIEFLKTRPGSRWS